MANVVVPAPLTGDLLYYDGANWINAQSLSGNYSLTGSLFGTASNATNALTAVSSSYAITASFASSSPAVYDFGSFATPTDVGGGGILSTPLLLGPAAGSSGPAGAGFACLLPSAKMRGTAPTPAGRCVTGGLAALQA